MANVWNGGRAVRAAAVAAAVAAAAGLVGCGTAGERPMSAGMFMPPATAVPTPTTAPGQPPVVADAQPAAAVVSPGEASPKKAMILTPSPAEFEAVRPLSPLQPGPTTAPADAAPAADPAPTPADARSAVAEATATGVYMTVGGVLAQVNDTPIYAHTVLALLDKELASKARDMDPDTFKQFAAERIVRQLHELMMDELDYSTAYKTLSKDDRTLADAVTAERRMDRVKQAGGSVELARREAAATGTDFEEQMRQLRRHMVVALYQQRQIDPQVQVSARDMREFYAANAVKLYGDKDRLLFRVIEVDPDQTRGAYPKVAALTRVRSIRDHAVAAGADFKAIASTDNDDPGLKARGGDVGGWMDRGSYRVDAVEAALWQLPPGGLTDVVEADGVYYVAKLEDKHVGRTKPFDDPSVQDDIVKQLTQRQQLALWEHIRNEAEAESVISTPDGKLETVLEMAMQKYAKWSGK